MLLNLFYSVGILVLMPLFFLFMLWKQEFTSKLEWFLDAFVTILIFVWLFQTGNWGWVSYYLRYIWLVVLIAVIYISWRKASHLPFRIEYQGSKKFNLVMYGMLIIVFGVMNALTLTSYTTKKSAIELDFPLQDGTYYVGQGGAQGQMNYHHQYEPQQYALDILKINALGWRASGLAPKKLSKYSIFADTLHSPCEGKVVDIRNTLPDLTPPESNPALPEGNFVSLSCNDLDEGIVVYLAHMQEDSVVVEPGMQVEKGQVIGKVGNSGNTTEPHLHIHAEKDGVGVPITFEGRFLVRNSLFR